MRTIPPYHHTEGRWRKQGQGICLLLYQVDYLVVSHIDGVGRRDVFQRDVIDRGGRRIDAEGQRAYQTVQKTRIGSDHVVFPVTHILRCLHGRVVERYETVNQLVVPLPADLDERFALFYVAHYHPCIVAGGQDRCADCCKQDSFHVVSFG